MVSTEMSLFPDKVKYFESFYHFYDLNKPLAFSLLTVFFMIRAVMMVSSGASPADFGLLFRDLLFTAIALVGFTSLLTMISHIPDFLITQIDARSIPQPPVNDNFSTWFFEKLGVGSDIIAIVVSMAVALVYLILMGLSVMFGPFIVLLSIMGNQGWLLKSLITVLVITSLWPVFWYLMNFFMSEALASSDWLVGTTVFVIGTIAKLGVPIALMKGLGRLIGAKDITEGAKEPVSHLMRATGAAGKMAGATLSFAGGAKYVNSLQSRMSGGADFIKNAATNLGGKIIPSMENTARAAGGFVGAGLSKITRPEVKSAASYVGGQAQRITSSIANTLRGPNQESLNLGSPVSSSSINGSTNSYPTKNSFSGSRQPRNYSQTQSSPAVDNHNLFSLGSPAPQSIHAPLEDPSKVSSQESLSNAHRSSDGTSRNADAIPAINPNSSQGDH